MRRVAAVGLLWLGACFAEVAPEGAPCADNGACPLGQTCEANICTSTPGQGGEGSDGTGNDGSGATSSPTAPFAPSNAVSSDPALTASGALGGAGSIVLDTDTGEIVRDGTVVRAAGAGLIADIHFAPTQTLGTFSASELTVDAGATLRAVGSRALVIVVGHDITINGTIDLSAGTCSDGTRDIRCAGPGGGTGGHATGVATGCGAGTRGDDNGDTGGGGGSFGAIGASGGNELDDGLTPFHNAVGGKGGPIDACSRTTLEPLVGGSGGGAGAGSLADGYGGDGGGGGGAVQLTSFGTIRVAGAIVASGGGGGGGANTGGGGGGSGGAILLESLSVVLDGGIVAANGGGGGGGGGTVRLSGQPGLAAMDPAAGGAQPRLGGYGGTRTTAATDGAAGGNDTGGGGGAIGAIRVRTRMLSDAGAVVTPSPTSAQL